MNYMDIFHISNIVFYTALTICGVLMLYKIIYHIVGLFPGKKYPKAKKDHKYAIIIPARDESRVITDLLESIANQTYNKNLLQTYVIVESESDPTCEIVKNYANTEIFIRQKLEGKGKGYALDEVFQKILSKNNDYEAYFIFDADNVLKPNYIEEMNNCFDAGYKMALGYRNSKNWNDGAVASCSALTFSMINTFQNKCRSRFNMNVIVSGTGFYISADVIQKLGGWKFFTLTEDYEISMYTALNNLRSTYNEHAEFYDEQPTKLKVYWNQRIRWIKGFNQTNKRYTTKLLKSFVVDKNNKLSKAEFCLSILPIALLDATIILYMLFNLIYLFIGLIIASPFWIKALEAFLYSGIAVYMFLMAYASVILLAERKHIDIKPWNALICVLCAPFYISLYVPIFIAGLLKKDVQWTKIEHKSIMKIK